MIKTDSKKDIKANNTDTEGEVIVRSLIDATSDVRKQNESAEKLLASIEMQTKKDKTKKPELNDAVQQAEHVKFIDDLNTDFDKKLIDIFADVADIDQQHV